MKSFKAVEETRRDYHANATLNSVHRASLLAPAFSKVALDVAFLNHFLLKRGYNNVACRVSEIDATGRRIQARMIQINEPRAYTLPLSEMAHPNATDFMIEFFSSDNLFIPFPAVMINHWGEGFLNCVHAYNRVLNDVFEDDAINKITQREAAIDVRLDDHVSTFLLLTAGQTACRGDIKLRLDANGRRLERTLYLDVPRFGHREVSLRDAFPDLNHVSGGVLTLEQPKQFMFYGRILAGQRAADGAFSANHSYYDSSETTEYWDDARPSTRLYPFFAAFENKIRLYPILSPGQLRIDITPRDHKGRILERIDAGHVETPGTDFIDVSINDACRRASVDVGDIAAFAVTAIPEGGNTPTRVNHQLVFVSGGLESSINVSLNNPNVFVPAEKKGFSWGQMAVGNEIETWLGVTANLPEGPACEVEASFYSAAGKLGDTRVQLPAGAARVFRPEELLPSKALPQDRPIDYVWFELRSERPDIYGYAVSRHRRTGHCTGEHGF